LLIYIVNPQNHKIDAKLGIAKNFMRLTNKTFLGINRIYNRLPFFSMFFGLAFGYFCSEVDTQVENILKNYEQTIKNGLIQSVLKNQ
jgi:hypothetical protein